MLVLIPKLPALSFGNSRSHNAPHNFNADTPAATKMGQNCTTRIEGNSNSWHAFTYHSKICGFDDFKGTSANYNTLSICFRYDTSVGSVVFFTF